MLHRSLSSNEVAQAQLLCEVVEQLRGWGRAHNQQVVGEAELDRFRDLDARVYHLAEWLDISVPQPATRLQCEGFIGLPVYRSNITRSQGGQRVVLDPGWDGRLKALQFGAQAVIDLGRRLPESAGTEEADGSQEWLPAMEAVQRADRLGYNVKLPWLSKCATKHAVKTRPRQLAGNHKLVVEWNPLAGYLARPKADAGTDDPTDDQKAGVEARKQQAAEQKRHARPGN
jgi:hypothetical protein